MPFVRQKIDPDWLPWVTKLAGCYRDAYGGDWAIDTERNAVFFFEGADALDSTLPRHYRLKIGTDVFAVEILDSERSPVLRAKNKRGGFAKSFISECLGAATSPKRPSSFVSRAIGAASLTDRELPEPCRRGTALMILDSGQQATISPPQRATW